MISNTHDLYVTLHQLASFTDMLEALRLDAESQKDYRQFTHLSKGYLLRIRELNGEIREYLRTVPEDSENEFHTTPVVSTAER
jgi:hypothetical protein